MKGILFDLDNTLYDEKLYFIEVFREFSNRHNFDLNDFINVYNSGLRHASSDFFGDILKNLGIYSAGYQKELFELYQTISCSLSMEPCVLDLLSFIRLKSLKIGVVTNGVLKVQHNKVKSLGLEKYVDEVVYARKWGSDFEKPHSRPFLNALASLDLNKEDVLFIGDDLFTDIKGAMACDIESIWLKTNRRLVADSTELMLPEIVITSLNQVKQIIKERI
ncbi:hydrolase [Thiomicrospira aerophila AL3]|uniref:Hydrolase n=1 Tax=Thiomicrospira aerophila AL3 TaxID=717772 RepID=W0DSI7_9GAMM|nr:hydrolase [Thiomicrospira aerophila AL3]